jgi:erythromycin esterase-like protein
MKDDRIRYRPVERAAVIDHHVRAFCLTSGNLRARDMAELYLAVLDQLTATPARGCAVSTSTTDYP